MVAAEPVISERGRRRAMAHNPDPRAVRTREKLLRAFTTALRESDPADMTVSALTRGAGVNRTSFYGHFSSPEDLAIHALSELFDVGGEPKTSPPPPQRTPPTRGRPAGPR